MGRIINHSRENQNVVPRVWELRPGEPRLILEASKPIMAGEEVLYDYNERRCEVRDTYKWLKK